MTYADLLRRSLEAEAAETVPPRSLVQAVLEQARHRTSGRSPERTPAPHEIVRTPTHSHRQNRLSNLD